MKLAVNVRRRRAFVSFLGSFMLVMMIPFVIGLAAYREVVVNLEQNANDRSLSTLNQCMAVLDRRFEEIETLASQLATNPKVLSFAREQNPYVDRTVPTKINELKEEVLPYSSTSNFISRIDLYFNKSDVTISPSMPHLTLDRYYGDFFLYDDMTSEQWREQIIGRKHFKEFFPEKEVKICTSYSGRNFDTQKMMMFLQSFPFTSMDRGFVMILIANSKIGEMLRDITAEAGGWAYITDGKGVVMASFAAPEGTVLPLDIDMAQEYGFARRSVDGRDVIATYTTSPKNGWKYVAVIPQATVMVRAQHIKNFIILILGIALAAGLAGSFAMAYWNIRPIRRVVATIRSFLGGDGEPGRENEFAYLDKSIVNLGRSKQSLEERLRRQQPLLKTTFVERLLAGGFGSAAEIQWMLEQLGFAPLQGPICVAIAKLNHAAGAAPRTLEETGMMKLLVVDEAQRRAGGAVYYHDLDFEKRALVFGLGQGRQDNREAVTSLLGAVAEALQAERGISVMFIVGALAADYFGIEKSFEEAREALDYKALHDDRKVLWHSDIPKESGSYFYPLHVENHLINFAKLGDIKEIERLLTRVHKENFVKRTLSPAMVRLLTYDLCGTIVKALDILAVEHAGEARSIRDALLPAVDQAQSVEELFALAQSAYREICARFAGLRRNRGDIKDRILEFVSENYADSQMSLTALADALGFAPAYLSQLVKDSTGENFSVLLENVRIGRACELLKGGMAVSNVAEKVGYNSVYVFRNAFKRVVGLPPSEYRESGRPDAVETDV